jgi:hypothetical protein
MALWNIAITGGVALGSVAWGAVASWRLGAAHVIAAALLVALHGLTLRWTLSAPDRLDVQLAQLEAPSVTLTPNVDDGPVLVSIRYRVTGSHYDDFVTAMRGVERQRRRTGAYRWGLFRDLVDPDLVVESYLVQSWGEHLRQHHRTTNTDVEVLGRARRHIEGEIIITHLLSCYTARTTANSDPML